MSEPAPRTEAGVAAGVPSVLRPPSTPRPDALAVVAWHLLDAPRTPEAFAAALPLAGVDTWSERWRCREPSTSPPWSCLTP